MKRSTIISLLTTQLDLAIGIKIVRPPVFGNFSGKIEVCPQ